MSARNLFQWIDNIEFSFKYYDFNETECVAYAQKKLNMYAKKF